MILPTISENTTAIPKETSAMTVPTSPTIYEEHSTSMKDVTLEKVNYPTHSGLFVVKMYFFKKRKKNSLEIVVSFYHVLTLLFVGNGVLCMFGWKNRNGFRPLRSFGML
jgi:hypothetical protein